MDKTILGKIAAVSYEINEILTNLKYVGVSA